MTIWQPPTPQTAPRLHPAWNAALAILDDSQWHPWDDITTAMLTASDIQPKTANNLLYDALRAGHLTRKGKTSRQIRLNPLGVR